MSYNSTNPEHMIANGVLSLTKRSFIRLLARPLVDWDDQVGPLQRNPLGMFFYNQRGVVLILSGFALLLLAGTARLSNSLGRDSTLLILLGLVWAGISGVTLSLHPMFVRRLAVAAQHRREELPRVFDFYFGLDLVAAATLFFAGRILRLPLDVFVWLLAANTVIYTAYVGGRPRMSRRMFPAVLLLLAVIAFSLRPSDVGSTNEVATLLEFIVVTSSVLLMIVLTGVSSWLRTRDQKLVKRQAQLLDGLTERLLSGDRVLASRIGPADNRRRVRSVLRDLCEIGGYFWYKHAGLWYVESHQDDGPLLVAEPGFHLSNEAARIPFVGWDQIIDGAVLVSEDDLGSFLREHPLLSQVTPRTRANCAVVPLRAGAQVSGLLVLSGDPGGPLPLPQEEVFLESLASTVNHSLEQGRARFRLAAHSEMDALYQCASLDDLFKRAARMLRDRLQAEACMVIVRRDPNSDRMKVEGSEGLKRSELAREYRVGEGLTGRSAGDGAAIRRDDVPRHRRDFDPDLLRQLERAIGEPVRSWLCVPLGSRSRNFGVIKVINSRSTCGWFTDRDEELAKDLALRLEVIIERFLSIDRATSAHSAAQRHLTAAESARALAERVAAARQDDLNVMAHQLQAPLFFLSGAISELEERLATRRVDAIREDLQYMREIVEDGFALCFGIFTTSALEAGKVATFSAEEIDAPRELEKLGRRVHRNSGRSDVDVRFKHESGFPVLRLDRNVFASVFYELIHNAVKYADPGTTIDLECSIERSTQLPALKVKSFGPPIHPSEQDRVFEKHGRGSEVEDVESGVGLGLWIARTLLRQFDWSVSLELSQREPKLSVFVVSPKA